MRKTEPIYILPAKDDPLAGLFSLANTCDDCKYVRNKEPYEYYRVGDYSPNAQCTKLDRRVSTHVGSCSALRVSRRVHLRRMWSRITWNLKDAYWWVIHRVVPKHRYHVAKTGLTPGYYDPCVRVLATIFTETEAFVAHQQDTRNEFRTDWAANEQHAKAWQVFKEAAAYGYTRRDCVTDEDDEQAVELAKKVLDNIGFMWY